MLKINLSLTTFASDCEFHYGIENFQNVDPKWKKFFTMLFFYHPVVRR